MTDAISKALAAAQKKAGEIAGAPAPVNLPAATAPAGGAVATYAPPAAPVSLDDMMVGSMQVDGWLKVKEFGIVVGNSSELFKELTVLLDMKEVAPCFVVKYGNPATYKKSYDHQSCVTGGTWADAIAFAQRVQSDAREYKSVDLPFVVIQDIIEPTSKKVLFESGKRLGHSTSTTNWANFETFYKDLKAKGHTKSKVLVKLGYEPRTNPKGNKWGVFTFQFLDVIPEEETAESAAA